MFRSAYINQSNLSCIFHLLTLLVIIATHITVIYAYIIYVWKYIFDHERAIQLHTDIVDYIQQLKERNGVSILLRIWEISKNL